MANGRLRVLSVPGWNFKNNYYFPQFCAGLESAGAEVIDVHDRRAKAFGFDVLHIHFPEHYVTERTLLRALCAAPIFAAFLLVARILGKTVVWTMHDVVPFKLRHVWLLRPYAALVRWCTNAYVFLNASSEVEFRRAYPSQNNKPACRLLLGPYTPHRILSPDERKELKAQLLTASDRLLVAFLGDIKPYKNIEVLGTIPERTAAGREISILVAGRVDPPEYATDVEALLDRVGRHRILRLGERLSDQRLEELVQAADVVLVPYTKGSNSSFAMFVLSCRSRVLASNLPMFNDLAEQIGFPWVDIANGPSGFSEGIRRVGACVVTSEDQRRLDHFLEISDFAVGGKTLTGFYQQIRSVSS